MTVKKTKPVYETSDGREFDNESVAKRHDEFIKVKITYEEARKEWTRVLAESQTTADGHPFEFSMSRDYWFVTRWSGRMPSLQKVSFFSWNCDVDDNEEGSLRQLEYNGGYDGGSEKWVSYRISELYLRKANATEALIYAQEEHIADLKSQLAKTIKG